MEQIQNRTQEILHEIWKKKARLFTATLIFVILLFLSFHYLYNGFNKRFIMIVLLVSGTAFFTVFPKPQKPITGYFMAALYLLFIPRKMFQRIELPINDMSGLREGAAFANILIILLIFAVFLLIFQRTSLAFGFGGVFLMVAFIVNYYVYQFRGSILRLDDILATRTAVSVLGNYTLAMDPELWYSILYFCFFIALGFWCDIPVRGVKYHIGITATAAAYCIFFYCFWNVSDYLEVHDLKGVYWNTYFDEQVNGYLLSFSINLKERSMQKPGGYSEEELYRITAEAEDIYEAPISAEEKPNIIFIMNEAWSDLRVLGDLETTQDYMPYVDSLEANTVKGNTYVNVLGGLTANSEFEALTGDSLAFLVASVVPYQLQVNHDMYSMARVLGEQGYQTMAMHPSTGNAWSRNKVYDYFGFDDFVDLSKFRTEYEFQGNFVSDESNFNEIISQYENKEEGKPLFLFNVTIQNHADYYGQAADDIHIESIGGVPVSTVGYTYDAETYINLMKITDDAFRELTEYFETIDDPTIICMFGDHQPNLNPDFYNAMFRDSELSEEEQTDLKYITPYVIWANYDVEFPEYGDMSANYLGAALLQCAGVELPDYYKFLLELQKEVPVITLRNVEQFQENESVGKYRMLEYNHLVEEPCEKAIFSVDER